MNCAGFRQRVPLPMVACMMDVSTGGAYYLATAADLICAYPGSVTGGIGVILNGYNLQDMMNQYNVLNQSIKAGQHIDMGSALQVMSPEVHDWLQAMADEYHQRFKEVVLDRRPQVARDDATTFDGRIFTATQAVERGLIDQLGTLEDAIAMARQIVPAGKRLCRDVPSVRGPGAKPLRHHGQHAHPEQPAAGQPPRVRASRLPTFLYMWEPDPTLERAKAYYVP